MNDIDPKRQPAGNHIGNPVRAFIAFNIPRSVQSHIRSIQQTFSSGGVHMRWTPVENVHLTLKFLGAVQEADLEKVADVVKNTAATTSPPSLVAGGVGIFPEIRRARVLWVGLMGDTASLVELQRRMDRQLEAIGFMREKRPFKAHLTIGRARGPLDPKKLAALMASAGMARSPSFTADKLILFQSELCSRGPVYTELKTAALKGADCLRR